MTVMKGIERGEYRDNIELVQGSRYIVCLHAGFDCILCPFSVQVATDCRQQWPEQS